MIGTEEAVITALRNFEARATRGDLLRIADYARLLDGLSETLAEPPAEVTLRWG